MSNRVQIDQQGWQDVEKQLRDYVRGRVSPAGVDDIVGNILLRLIQNRDALQTADNREAYVQRVATNAVTDHYRRRAAEARALDGVKAEADTAYATDDDKADRTDEATTAITRCMHPFIKNLPEAYRDALTLTEVEHLSQKQAAERLGLSVSGLKSRVQRGRVLLKKAVTTCCSIEMDRRGQIIDYERRTNSSGKSC